MGLGIKQRPDVGKIADVVGGDGKVRELRLLLKLLHNDVDEHFDHNKEHHQRVHHKEHLGRQDVTAIAVGTKRGPIRVRRL